MKLHDFILLDVATILPLSELVSNSYTFTITSISGNFVVKLYVEPCAIITFFALAKMTFGLSLLTTSM